MPEAADLAEIALLGDLLRLDRGAFTSKREMLEIVAAALRSLAILEREGGFSRGEAALTDIRGRLLALQAETAR